MDLWIGFLYLKQSSSICLPTPQIKTNLYMDCVDSSWNWLQTTQSLVYWPWNRGPLLPEAAFLEGPLGKGALLSGNIYKASVMHRALCWALWGLQRWTSHGCCSQGIFNKACLFRCQKWRCKITTERNKKKKKAERPKWTCTVGTKNPAQLGLLYESLISTRVPAD